MAYYFGVLIEQSLRNPDLTNVVEVIHREQDPNGSWVFLLARIPEEGAPTAFARLQSAIANDQPWYAHFFRAHELVVVYSDRVFFMSTNPETWNEAIAHGRNCGIPEAQLDFRPHTIGGIKERFGIELAGS